jgi:hypothetical protein
VDRRGFLSSLIAGGLSAAVDPDRLLWEPGKKLISIPKPVFPEGIGMRFIRRYQTLTFHQDAFVLTWDPIRRIRIVEPDGTVRFVELNSPRSSLTARELSSALLSPPSVPDLPR